MMEFPQRLVALRKQHGLTQQNLADKASIHVSQIKRYEYGEAQPALDVIRKIAIALNVSADLLVFDKEEREPVEELKMQFEAIKRFSPKEQEVAKILLDSLIVHHDVSQFNTLRNYATNDNESS